MKILLVVNIALALFYLSCVSSKRSISNSSTKSTGKEVVITEADRSAGLEIFGKSDCPTCHRINERAIGPSYRSVSEKYAATQENIDWLAKKIISGGTGNWGNIPMTPHPNLDVESARTVVKFVLSVKKSQ